MKIKFFFINIFSQFRSIYMVFLNIFSSRETRLYPEEPLNLSSRYRGRIILTKDLNGNERCVACNLCAAVCPVDCISLEKSETKKGRWYAKNFQINFSRCIFCGLCEEACPTLAIQLTPDIELSEFVRHDLLYQKKDLLINGPGKFTNYNFYSKSGVNIFDRKNNSINLNKKNDCVVDITSLLP